MCFSLLQPASLGGHAGRQKKKYDYRGRAYLRGLYIGGTVTDVPNGDRAKTEKIRRRRLRRPVGHDLGRRPGSDEGWLLRKLDVGRGE